VVNRVFLPLDCRKDLSLVDEAVALAQAHGAQLVVVAGSARPAFCAVFAPGAYGHLCSELADEAGRLVSEAVARVPQDVSVRSWQEHRSALRTLAPQACCPGDVLLMRGDRRATRRFAKRCAAQVMLVGAPDRGGRSTRRSRRPEPVAPAGA
jgi:hypothetical protein